MKYLVKVTYKAKDNNPNFAGQTHINYFGKYETMMDEYKNNDKSYMDWFKGAYGYARKCDAKRNYHFKFPNDEIYWTKKVEIVEV